MKKFTKKRILTTVYNCLICGILSISLSLFCYSDSAYASVQCRLLSPNSPNDFNTFLGEGFGPIDAIATSAARNDCLTRNSSTACSYGIPACRTIPDPEPPPPSGPLCARFYNTGDATGLVVELRGSGRDAGSRELNAQAANISAAIVEPNHRAWAFKGADYDGDFLRLDKDPQLGRANAIFTTSGAMKFTYFPGDFNDNIRSVYCEALQ